MPPKPSVEAGPDDLSLPLPAGFWDEEPEPSAEAGPDDLSVSLREELRLALLGGLREDLRLVLSDPPPWSYLVPLAVLLAIPVAWYLGAGEAVRPRMSWTIELGLWLAWSALTAVFAYKATAYGERARKKETSGEMPLATEKQSAEG